VLQNENSATRPSVSGGLAIIRKTNPFLSITMSIKQCKVSVSGILVYGAYDSNIQKI